MTFMPAYLRGLGLSGREISTVFTVTPLLALAVPLAWAYLADRTQRHDRVLRVVVGGAWLAFTPMLFARGFPVIQHRVSCFDPNPGAGANCLASSP